MPTMSPLSAATERPPRPRIVATLLALFAAVALIAGACSNDDKSSEKDSEPENSEPENAEPENAEDAGDATVADGPEADFTTTVETAGSQLQAMTDPCEIVDIMGPVAQLDPPGSTEEAKAAIDYYVLLLNTMADTSSSPQVAETLKTGASEVQKYAEGVEYDPDALTLSETGPDYEGAEATAAAIEQWGQAEFSNCAVGPQPIPPS